MWALNDLDNNIASALVDPTKCSTRYISVIRELSCRSICAFCDTVMLKNVIVMCIFLLWF